LSNIKAEREAVLLSGGTPRGGMIRMASAIFGLTFLAAIGSGLVAGIFFGFSTFIMSGLGRIQPEQGVAAMQSINVTVLNPAFFLAFFGTAALCLALAVAALFRWDQPGSAFILAASLIYLIGCIGVTIFANVPLNDALAAVRPGTQEAGALWSRYLDVWTAWNHARTAASLAAAALFTLALI
jgi:uncharacterized membrane protein